MDIKIYGKNIEVTDGIKSAIKENLRRIEKYIVNKYGEDIENSTTANVCLEVKKRRHKVEISLVLDGQLFRAEQDLDDMYVSIASCVKNLESQIKKHNKIQISKKQKNRNIYDIENKVSKIEEENELLEEIKFSRIKDFKLEAMTPEDAVDQMNSIGHDFYVFRNSLTNTVDVVYKRKEDTYGLIRTN